MGNLGLESWDSFDKRYGDHNDGIYFFPINSNGEIDYTSSNRGLIVANHENNETMFQHKGGRANWVSIVDASGNILKDVNGNPRYIGKTGWGNVYRTDWREVIKEAFSIGVSVVEVYRESIEQPWKVNVNGKYNKRYHQTTPIEYSGIAKGSNRLKTKFDPTGTKAQGIKNLCGMGVTPWGTYLTAEENQWQYYGMNIDSVAYSKLSASEKLHHRRYMSYGNSLNNKPATVDSVNGVASFYYLCIAQGKDSSGNLIDPEASTIPQFAKDFIDSHDLTPSLDSSGNLASATMDYRNGLNTGNFIVEIDPFSPMGNQGALKRTSLGRAGWENAVIGTPVAGKKLAVYLPCDSNSEYIYKYLSNEVWNPEDAKVKYSTVPGAKIAVGSKYLDNGTYHVAKFNEKGVGTWIKMDLEANIYDQPGKKLKDAYPMAKYGNVSGGSFNDTSSANQALFTDVNDRVFKDEADVRLFARLAGSYVGATRMDRPEWIDVDPLTNVIYCALTNNSNRKIIEGSTFSNPGVDPANPRVTNPPSNFIQDGSLNANGTITYPSPNVNTGENGNRHGHVIRWLDMTNNKYDPESTSFNWEIYAFGCAGERSFRQNVSRLSEDNDFSSPDTCYFSKASNALWIQSDDGNYAGTTNNQALICIPGNINDGYITEVDNRSYDSKGAIIASKKQETKVGSLPVIRRFLVGPRGCEITGFGETPDGKTTFACIQHPGEDTPANWNNDVSKLDSTWPFGGANRPRSSLISIRKRKGYDGPIGLNKPRQI